MKQKFEKFLREEKIPLSSLEVDKLFLYWKELSLLGPRMNLISKRLSFEEIFFLQILDSLMLSRFISPLPQLKVADLGTGAGLPGIPLSLAWRRNRFYLIDSRQSSISFLRREKTRLSLENIEIVPKRIEEAKLNQYDFLLVRALMPLEKLSEEIFPLLKEEAVLAVYQSMEGWRKLRKGLIKLSEDYFWQVFFYKLPMVDRKRSIILFRKGLLVNG